MTLDDRARRSAEGLRQKVEEADLQLFAAGMPAGAAATRPALASRVLAFAGAFALVVMALGLAVVQMNMVAGEGTTPATEPPTATVTEPPPVSTSVETTPTTAPPATTTPPETTVPADVTPPHLEITSPVDGEAVESHLVNFVGITEPGATVTRGKFAADVDAEGNWSLVLVVSEGTTTVVFTATDEDGNESQAGVTVSYEEPKEEEPGVGFTAYATFGECEEDPPYDEYYGTAAPEAKITISSVYGGGTTFADGEGNWFLRVEFPEAPKNKPFEVTVKDDLGNKKTFSFVAKGV